MRPKRLLTLVKTCRYRNGKILLRGPRAAASIVMSSTTAPDGPRQSDVSARSTDVRRAETPSTSTPVREVRTQPWSPSAAAPLHEIAESDTLDRPLMRSLRATSINQPLYGTPFTRRAATQESKPALCYCPAMLRTAPAATASPNSACYEWSGAAIAMSLAISRSPAASIRFTKRSSVHARRSFRAKP